MGLVLEEVLEICAQHHAGLGVSPVRPSAARPEGERPLSAALSIDVVVLCLDREQETQECIDSVLRQDHPGVQLWLVDQGSQPQTAGRLSARAQADGFHFLHSGPVGIAAGRNIGFGRGTAEVIVSLDNDALLADAGSLSRVAELMAAKDAPAVVGFAVYDGSGSGPDHHCWVYPRPVETHFGKSFSAARFCGGAHAIRRRAFESVGGYDETFFFFGEELDLAYSLIAHGFEIHYQPEVAVWHKASDEARIDWDTGRYYYNVRNMLYLNEKHFRNPGMRWQYAAGFLIKGLRNGLSSQAWRGVRDGLRLAASLPPGPGLDADARRYIEAHELEPRGSRWTRFRQEVMAPMRPTGTP